MGFNIAKKPTDDIEVRKAIAYGSTGRLWWTVLLRPGRCRDAVHAAGGRRVRGRRDDVRLRPGEGEEDPAGRGYTPGGDRVLVSDRRVAAVHAGPEAELRGLPGEPEQVGLQGDAEERPWNPDYLGRADAGTAGNLRLLGWTGDYGDADNFIGTFFQSPQRAWGTTTTPLTEIQNLLNEGEAETDEAKRQEIYENANRAIMEQLPGVLQRALEPALAFDADVKGYVASPTTNESFAPVTLGG